MQTSRRKFIAGLGALAAAIVAAPVVRQGLAFHRDAFALTMRPL